MLAIWAAALFFSANATIVIKYPDFVLEIAFRPKIV
jgi:hypothetical protein